MQTAEHYSTKLLELVIAKMPVTPGTRESLHREFVRVLDPVVPSAQRSLGLTDADTEAFKGQCEAILKLLRQRRSTGALTHELAAISLKYSSRLDELRKAGWRITCSKANNRTFRYVLSPEMW